MGRKEPMYKHKCALLIDDSELDNFINEKMLEAHYFAAGIYIHTSATGALEFLHNLAKSGNAHSPVFPEVIFVDLNMPIMDGFQFIAAFKKSFADRELKPKLVILTSSVSPKDKLRAEKLDKEIVFLNKPLTSEMLKLI